MLYATLGLEIKYLIISFIRVIPLVRRTANAVFCNAAMICGVPPHRTDDASSPSSVSRIQ